MNEGALGVHQIELVVQSRPGLGDGGGVGEHADRALHLRQIASGHNSRRLVVNADLKNHRLLTAQCRVRTSSMYFAVS